MNNPSSTSKNKIVLINQATGYLFRDVANEFSKIYDEVILMTGSEMDPDELNKNIVVVPIYPYKKRSTVSRFISWIAGFSQLLFLVMFRYRGYELFISSNPPLATILPLFCKNRTSLLIYDVYPDGLVSGGFVSKDNFLFNIWSYLNKKAYAKTEQLISITGGMSKLLENYTENDKITLIPVWADRKIFNYQSNGVNRFKKKYGLENKFVVMYSGNMGKNHALESLVFVAENLRQQEDLHFVIAGEGWKKKLVKEMIENLNLKNCTILSYMPTDLFISSLYGIDVGVISLGEDTSKIAIPSKTFNLLAAGKPLLCFADKKSDLADLVAKCNVGETFAHHEIDEATEFVKTLSELSSSSQKKFSENAVIASKKYNYENAARIAELVFSLHQQPVKR